MGSLPARVAADRTLLPLPLSLLPPRPRPRPRPPPPPPPPPLPPPPPPPSLPPPLSLHTRRPGSGAMAGMSASHSRATSAGGLQPNTAVLQSKALTRELGRASTLPQ